MPYHDHKIPSRRVPFLKPWTALYIAGADSAPQDAYVSGNEAEIRDRLSYAGFSFLHLPELLESIPSQVLDYLFPLQDGFDLPSVYANIRHCALLGDQAGWLYKRGRNVFFHKISEDASGLILPDLETLFPTGKESRHVLLKMRAITEASLPIGGEFYDEAGCEGGLPPLERCLMDERTAAILDEIDRITREFDISLEDLELLLGYRVRLSHIQISRGGRIFLSDFDREVRMNQLSKAVYFLYLRHPEGIRFKEVADHRRELLDLYLGITGRGEQDGIERTIDRLVDPFGNELNVCASRIKAAFRNVVSDRVSRFYCLEGAAGEIKKVPLDRDLVIWEN